MPQSDDRALTLDDIRAKAARFAVLFLWAHVPVVAGMALWLGNPVWPTTLAMAAIAATVTADWRRAPRGRSVQLTASAAMAIAVGLMVYQLAGHPWQIDMHMYFFAAFALTAVFCNWRAVLVYAVIVAAHHLSLNFLLPAAIWPEGMDFARVLLHAAIVVIQGIALVWLVSVLEKAFQSAAAALGAAEAAEAETRRLGEEKLAADRRAAAERRAEMNRLADTFDGEVNSAVSSLMASMSEARGDIEQALTLNRRTTDQTLGVASASEQMSQNVQTVATASEELAATTSEIGKRVDETVALARQAGEESQAAREKGRSLSHTSRRIEEVIGLIADIAEQTNLLALNATIEAARAGEAGKGFAVVANEVKSLAVQTARATEDVRKEVTAIVGAIAEVADALERVSDRNEEMSGVFASVASAVEEQLAATQEIARNIQQAAAGTDEVARTIARVRDDTVESKRVMDQVHEITGQLNSVATRVSDRSEEFLGAIRAG